MRFIDFMVGLFMLAGIAGLLTLTYRVSNFSDFQRTATYNLSANFDNVGGLKVRSPVTVSGVKIGQVSAIELNPTTFKAKVTLIIDEQDNNLPVDTSASIYTQGLLGSNYISLVPGFSTESLKDGDMITTTRSALILEELIGQLMFKLTGGNSSSTDSASSAPVSSVSSTGANTPSENPLPATTTQPGTAAT